MASYVAAVLPGWPQRKRVHPKSLEFSDLHRMQPVCGNMMPEGVGGDGGREGE